MVVYMKTIQQFSITLSSEMANIVKKKVATGEYATESEVIKDSLNALIGRDKSINRWLQKEVAPAYDALRADSKRALSIDQVKSALAKEHEKATMKS